ncbi:hypothetical protein LEP3755_18740 [Leptolyngbya sp. NIES-3755]|nr:hypothetical protein LEP3755_18740 [Leptolyngbya sp. NIES-3755]
MRYLLSLIAAKSSKPVGSLVLLLSAIALFTSPAQAEGSRELTSSGGDRPFLEYRSSSSVYLGGIPRRNIISVYAKANETINLGSSAIGVNGARILYRQPNGTSGTCDGTTGGLIPNIAAETAGPFHPTANPAPNAFTPCIILVTAATQGIWQIEFESPGKGTSDPAPINATAPWSTQGNGDSWVTAWDVTVRDSSSGIAQPGRAFANYLSLNMGNNGRSLSSKVYIQTVDGYGYTIDMNGIDPFGFAFFANNKGFRSTATGNPIYRSLQFTGANPGTMPSGYSIHFPNSPDDSANRNFTHKIFFNTTNTPNTPNGGPDTTMPPSAISASGSTWLFQNPVVPPMPSNLTFTGVEGTSGAAGTSPLGGNFTFTSTAPSAYSIVIDLNGDGVYGNTGSVNGVSITDRYILGTAVAGPNTVFWDGKDQNGVTVPASANVITAVIRQYAGEIHFPFLDPENNPRGLIIERVKDPGTATAPRFQVFYDDRFNSGANDNSLCASGEGSTNCYGTPPSPRQAVDGTADSTNGAHAWTNNFGDIRGMDTWAYYPSAASQTISGFVIREADLSVTKTDNLTVIAPGSTLTYTITVRNSGPSDAIGATFRDTMPTQLTNATWTCTASSGSSCGTASGTGNIDTTVNLLNGGTLTYTVTGVVSTTATGVISNTATILRPNDVNDPTDQGRTGAGNNSATDTTTITTPTTNVLGRKSVRFLTDTDNSNSVTVGDEVEYTIAYSNLAPTATSDAINFVIDESLPIQLTYVPGSATITATAGNNIALAPGYNGTGAITTLVTGTSSANSSTLRVQDTVTIRLRATINSANNGNSIDNQAIATFRTPTSATSNTIVTDADSAGATSNPPSVGNFFSQVTDDGVNTGNGASTADDDRTSIRVNAIPNLRLVKRITALNGTTYTDVIDDPADPNDNSSLNWTSSYLIGRTGKNLTAADTVPVKPGDSLEYTIYFLSDGTAAAQNVTLCDLIPTNTTFLSNVFNSSTPKDSGTSTGDFGLRLTIDTATVYLSNADDTPDRGRYYAPGTSAPCGNNGTSVIAPNGAVTVRLNTIPNATTRGTPNSFGFIRFRARVN